MDISLHLKKKMQYLYGKYNIKERILKNLNSHFTWLEIYTNFSFHTIFERGSRNFNFIQRITV